MHVLLKSSLNVSIYLSDGSKRL